MFEAPEVPEALKEVHDRNALHGGVVSLESPGYEEAMRLCNNMTGTGETYDRLAGPPPNLNEEQRGRTILLPTGIFRHGPYHERQVDGITTTTIAGVDIITFPPAHGIAAKINDLRRVIPPTLPVPLSKALIRKLRLDSGELDEDDQKAAKDNERNRSAKVRRYLRRAEPQKEDESPDGESVTTGDFGPEILYSPAATQEAITREHIRNLIADSRGLQPHELTLFYGAEEALTGIATLYRKTLSTIIRPKIAIPPHDYQRFIRFAHFLGFQPVPLGLDYSNFKDTTFDPDSKLFYFSSPRNPDGNVLSPEEISDLLSSLPDHATVIVDNTSISHEHSVRDYSAGLRQIMTEAQLAKGQTVIVTGSLSKEEQGPWLRCGFALTTSRNVHDALSGVEAHIPPNLGRVISNRMRWVDERGLRESQREYMRGFHASLREIENITQGRMQVYRPPTAKAVDRYPSGYHCVIELPHGNDAERFQENLTSMGREAFNVDVKPPMRGNCDSTSDPEELDPKIFTRSGMAYMAETSVRLITTGPDFQLYALAKTLGIE